MWTWILLILLVALVVLTLYCRYCSFGRHLANIPGPPRVPLLGNAMQTLGLNPASAFKFIRRINKTYGQVNVLSSFLIGVVNVWNPECVEKLISTHQYTSKKKLYNFLHKWLGGGLLVSNGEKWRHRRKLLTPAFHFTILKRFLVTFNERTEMLIQKLEAETDKEWTDVTPIVTRSTLNIICETSMGLSVNDSFDSLTSKYFNALHIYANFLVQRLMSVWLHVDWIHNILPLGRKETKLVADLQSITKKIVEDRRVHNNNISTPDDGKRKLAMLDLLLENEKEGKIDMDGIREEVDTFLFEGHDTVGMALCFMLMRIANEPEAQDRIYEELVQIFGDDLRRPTMEDLQKMKYLELCIKESLRIYPSVPFMSRYTSEDVDMGKYTIPKEVIVFIHVFDLHRIPEIYPEPEKFIPERFLPENIAERNPYAYIPFSAGPRNCIGQKFAMAEMKTIMSSVLRKFRLEPVTRPENLEFYGDIILRTTQPLKVKFRKRVNNA